MNNLRRWMILCEQPLVDEAFKRWFGASQVVDNDGNPLRVFHGTKSDIKRFDLRGKSRTGGKAYFFTPDPIFAELYANKGGEEGAQIYPVYLRIVNMFDNSNISHLSKLSAAVDAILKKEQARPDAYSKARSFYPYTWKSVLAGIQKGNWDALEQPIVIDALQKAGFDGATIKEGANHNFMVFKAAQIKSTMNTTWDGKNPNISEGCEASLTAAWDHLVSDLRQKPAPLSLYGRKWLFGRQS